MGRFWVHSTPVVYGWMGESLTVLRRVWLIAMGRLCRYCLMRRCPINHKFGLWVGVERVRLRKSHNTFMCL